jgi:hypothetical protein
MSSGEAPKRSPSKLKLSPCRVLIFTSLRLPVRFAVGLTIALRAPGVCAEGAALVERAGAARGDSCARTSVKLAHRKTAALDRTNAARWGFFRVIGSRFPFVRMWVRL